MHLSIIIASLYLSRSSLSPDQENSGAGHGYQRFLQTSPPVLNESTLTYNQPFDNANMEKDIDNTNMEKDMEKDMEKVMDLDKSEDPFAGEEVGGVRYRTMKWW